MTAHSLHSGLMLKATLCQIQLARLLAQARKRGHDHCRTQAQSVGSQTANLAADFWGALAEILLLDGLERAGYKPYFALLKDRSPFGLDVRLDGRTFDIKASPPGKPYLCINATVTTRHSRHPTTIFLACSRVMIPCLSGKLSLMRMWRSGGIGWTTGTRRITASTGNTCRCSTIWLTCSKQHSQNTGER